MPIVLRQLKSRNLTASPLIALMLVVCAFSQTDLKWKQEIIEPNSAAFSTATSCGNELVIGLSRFVLGAKPHFSGPELVRFSSGGSHASIEITGTDAATRELVQSISCDAHRIFAVLSNSKGEVYSVQYDERSGKTIRSLITEESDLQVTDALLLEGNSFILALNNGTAGRLELYDATAKLRKSIGTDGVVTSVFRVGDLVLAIIRKKTEAGIETTVGVYSRTLSPLHMQRSADFVCAASTPDGKLAVAKRSKEKELSIDLLKVPDLGTVTSSLVSSGETASQVLCTKDSLSLLTRSANKSYLNILLPTKQKIELPSDETLRGLIIKPSKGLYLITGAFRKKDFERRETTIVRAFGEPAR